MATLAEQAQGERMARVVLSMIAEPDDLTTGYILGRHGGVATLSLVESDHDVTGLGRANVLLWRERLRARIAALHKPRCSWGLNPPVSSSDLAM